MVDSSAASLSQSWANIVFNGCVDRMVYHAMQCARANRVFSVRMLLQVMENMLGGEVFQEIVVKMVCRGIVVRV